MAFSYIERGNFDGCPRNLYSLLKGINRNVIEPYLISTTEDVLTLKLSQIGINIIILPIPNELNIYNKKLLKISLFNLINIIKGLYKYQKSLEITIKDLDIDVFWCVNIRNLIMSFYILKKRNIKLIWNIWSEGTNQIISKLIHLLGLFIADEVNFAYVGQKKKIFSFLGCGINLFKKKFYTLYTGVINFEILTGANIRKELGIDKTAIILFMASDIYPLKGQLDLLKAVFNIMKHSNVVHLLLAGETLDGQDNSKRYYDDMKKYINKNKLMNNVHLLGWRNDIPDLLNQTDIYISTSYSESLPTTIREAMKYSKPVIATNVGGTPELITNNLNGYLFDPGNYNLLSDFLLVLIDNQSLREKMGIFGKKVIDKKFSSRKYILEFEKMIIKCVTNNKITFNKSYMKNC